MKEYLEKKYEKPQKKDIKPHAKEKLIAGVDTLYPEIMEAFGPRFRKEKRSEEAGQDHGDNYQQISVFFDRPVLEYILKKHLENGASFNKMNWKLMDQMKDVTAPDQIADVILATAVKASNVVNAQEAQAYLKAKAATLRS